MTTPHVHRKLGLPWLLLLIAVVPILCGIPKGLDLKLMKEVTTNLSKNEAISPFVISTLMSQVWLAAGGSTRDEITPVLGVEEPATLSFLPAFKSAIMYISGSSQLTAAVFNRMYVRSRYPVKQSFSELLALNYGAGAVSFSSPSQAADRINSDVSNVTRNHIKKLVSRDMLDNAAVVLVSALYFKGEWKYAFNAATSASFLTQGGEKQVNMMKLNLTELLYKDMETYDVVALPYTDEDYCMLLIRPVERSMAAVATLKNSLDILDIDDIVRKLSPTEVTVRMPRFKIEAKYSLKGAMIALGIEKIFTLDADLSGLTDRDGLAVTDFVHKVFIEVNENGTVAAGAGAVVISDSEPPEFIADRPFFAVVYNKRHRINMFTAYLGSP